MNNYKPLSMIDDKKHIALERCKLINLLRKLYSVPDMAKIFNVSRSIAYRAASTSPRDISLQERMLNDSEFLMKVNAWSNSMIQYENYFFSNILPRMRLARLKLDTAPKQKWMQKHGFSPFINALNEKKLKNYGMNNVTDFWKYLRLKLNYEKDIWTADKKQYIEYFKEKIFSKMTKQGLDTLQAPSNSWLDKNGFSVFRRMVRKKLFMTHNEFFKELGLKIWEKNKWSGKISQYRYIVANRIYPEMIADGLDVNQQPKHNWLRENGFRPFVAAIEHGRLKEQDISCMSDFWANINS